jgi:chorismate dehydratase
LDYPVKISAVSYLNTLPFHFGLENSYELKKKISLSKDIPSICADKLISGEVDIGLIPVAEISKIPSAKIISDYCIGAVGKVNTVLLLSDVKLTDIKRIFLDYQSRTSVNLLKIVAKQYWKIKPRFLQSTEGYEEQIKDTDAGLIIGDRAFQYMNQYKYIYDLSDEWMKYTGLPFVFAAWVANKKMEDNFLKIFNRALKFGLESIKKVSDDYEMKNPNFYIDIFDYLKNDISFILDVEKKRGMNTFMRMLKSI